MTLKPKTAGNALRLSLGGAPETWHVVGNLNGMFHPSIPVPLTQLGLSEDEARALHDEAGMPLELVTITDAEAKANAVEQRVAMGETREAIADAIRQRGVATEEERARMKAQADATSTTTTDIPDRSES